MCDSNEFVSEIFEADCLALGLSFGHIYAAEEAAKLYAPPLYCKGAAWFLACLFKFQNEGSLRIDLAQLKNKLALWPGSLELGLESLLQSFLKALQGGLLSGFVYKEIGAIPAPVAISSGRYVYLCKNYCFEQRFLALAKRVLFPKTQTECFKLPLEAKTSVTATNLFLGLQASQETLRAIQILHSSDLLLLSGGPGSGKTTALSALLKSLILSARAYLNRSLLITLAAPTGRAAARMAESLSALDPQKQFIELPLQAFTLHTLLGYNPHTGRFKFHAENRLAADIIALDESSMIDIFMFKALLEALPENCKLILTGDANQLPSIEMGAVFADLVKFYDKKHSLLYDNTVFLTKCYRSNQVILKLAQSCLAGQTDEAEQILQSDSPEIEAKALTSQRQFAMKIFQRFELHSSTKQLSFALGDSVGAEERALEVLYQTLQRFIVLTPLKEGLFGSIALNKVLDEKASPFPLYHGKPIIITANESRQGLYNGDRGIIVQRKESFYGLFKQNGCLNYVPAALLPPWETAYVLTIHKSQGSEFDEVAVLLPSGAHKLLSRRLVYTALTRAKQKVLLYGQAQELALALKVEQERESALAAATIIGGDTADNIEFNSFHPQVVRQWQLEDNIKRQPAAKNSEPRAGGQLELF